MIKVSTEEKLPGILQDLRVKKGLSQADVCKMLGYTTAQFVSNWERAVSEPPANTIPKLANIYGVSYEYLFNAVRDEKLRKLSENIESKREK